MPSGHLEKRKGNWYIVLELEGENGKRERKWISVRKELGLNRPAQKTKEAKPLLDKLLTQLHEGRFVEPSKMTLGKYLDIWLSNRELNLRRSTIDGYKNYVNNHIKPVLGSVNLSKLKPLQLQRFIDQKQKEGLAPQTVRHMYGILRRALGHAVRMKELQRNPLDGVTQPKRRWPSIKFWNLEEARTFLSSVQGHRHYPLYLLALTTGLRRGELLGLRWKDVDTKKRTISIRQTLVPTKRGPVFEQPKTESSIRTLDISPAVAAELEFHRMKQDQLLAGLEEKPDHDLVFTTIRGTPILPRNISRHFDEAVTKLEITRISFHGMRHTYATMLLEKRVPQKVVAERLGHTTTAMTDRYTHVLPRMAKDTAEKTDDLINLKDES